MFLLRFYEKKAFQALLLVLCGLVFLKHAREYEYVQDDAYISLVYAQNWVDGYGLVFNAGERVEGYTNFLWTLLLTVPCMLDEDAVSWAQWMGFISIFGTMFCCVAITKELDAQRSAIWRNITPALLAANGALGFWALCGLETAFFTLLLTAGAYAYLRELQSEESGYATAFLFSLAALTRPEGLAFYALTALHRAAYSMLRGRFVLTQQIRYTLPFALIIGAHFVFRYAYYGALLPNTFYAKTGWETDYLKHGLSYAHRFVEGYGLWGLLFVAPPALAYWRRYQPWFSYLSVLVLFNVLYIVVIGGDGWSEHRFFIPLLPLMYIALQEGLCVLANRMPARWPQSTASGCVLAFVVLLAYHGYSHASASLKRSQRVFLEHNARTEKVASYIKNIPPSENFTLATCTIGIVKYRTGVRVVDMLGLTDAHIARHPVPLPRVESHAGDLTRKYDTAYVLDQQPDLVFFLTGLKPIKRAEKALYISRRFRQRYYAAYVEDEMPVFVIDESVPSDSRHDSFANVDFVEHYIAGLNASGKDWSLMATHMKRAVEVGPTDFPYAHQSLGLALVKLGRQSEAEEVLTNALSSDERCVKALVYLSLAHIKRGEFASAEPLALRAVELSPDSQQVRLTCGLSLIFSRPRTALEHLQQAAKARGANGDEASFYWGLAHKIIGEPKRARVIWEDLLSRTPDDQRLQRAISSL